MIQMTDFNGGYHSAIKSDLFHKFKNIWNHNFSRFTLHIFTNRLNWVITLAFMVNQLIVFWIVLEKVNNFSKIVAEMKMDATQKKIANSNG